MKSIRNLSLVLIALFIAGACTRQNDISEREVSFNNGWKFIRADVDQAQAPGFDDSGWRELNLPHDYSIEDLPSNDSVKQVGPFSEKSAGGASTGHVVGGTAWYRKHFTLDKQDEGKLVKILFDGVYMNADFWINGNHLGNHPYGYTAFSYDLTPYLNPAGEENVLAVEVKNEGKNSRWYSGSGIYRNVKLVKTDPLHVDQWGVFVQTKSVTPDEALLGVDVSLTNQSQEDKRFTLRMDFMGPDGNAVTYFEDEKELTAGSKTKYEHEFALPGYRLWSVDHPELYKLVVQLRDGKKVIDEVTQTFGIRTLEFSPEKGFLLNGQNILLKGGCMHHDNGILGAAAFETAEFRRVKTMKEYGYNAIRTAHNPPSEAFLDACDRLGMLVMDESFDHWQKPKNDQDYNLYFDQWWEKDLEAMVLRDRNHPSIIIWSFGNEIKERADSSGLAIASRLKEKIKSLDPSRPVTQAVCSFWDNPGLTWDDTERVFALLDVHGYNYQWKQYEPDHEKFPERIMIGTESIALEAFENWQLVERHPYIIGDFVWTGMDYLGESGIGSTKLDSENQSFLPPWPWFNANCGDVSILGYKKPQLYFRDVIWGNSNLEMMVHAPVPAGQKEIVSFWGWPDEQKSWNWEGAESQPLEVSVYSSFDKIRLELNGQLVGEQDVSHETKLTAKFNVPYQPGELTAIGYKDGQEVERQTLKTTGKPYRLKITPEKDGIAASSSDLAYFNVEVLDEAGQLVPDAVVPVEFVTEGGYALQAAGNDNPVDMRSFQQPSTQTFRGRCQLIVRSSEQPGEMVVKASSAGLQEGTASVKVGE